jgi:trans-2,3-dihydro-3-hydroxyanthranilate isomerase
MAKTIKIYQIDAFTDKAFGGNPAGVTLGENLSKEEMQLIAKEMNLSETAFIIKSDETDKADYDLRWFTPLVEVDLCGHATIASLHSLKENNLLKEGQEIKLNTTSGILKCRYEDGKYFMQIPLFSMKEFTGDKEEIMDALGGNRSDFDGETPFILIENGYLFIKVKTLKGLSFLKPNFKALYELTATKNEFGCIAVYTLETVEKENFAHSRFFAPFFGIDEDPVTGSMNGPLLPVLIRTGLIKNEGKELNYTFEQGDVLGRNGRVGVTFYPDKNELYISGKAVTVLKGELIF